MGIERVQNSINRGLNRPTEDHTKPNLTGREVKRIEAEALPGGVSRKEALALGAAAMQKSGDYQAMLRSKEDKHLARKVSLGHAYDVSRGADAIFTRIFQGQNLPFGSNLPKVADEMQTQFARLGAPVREPAGTKEMFRLALGQDDGPGGVSREGYLDAKKGEYFLKTTDLVDRGRGAWGPGRASAWYGPFKLDGQLDGEVVQKTGTMNRRHELFGEFFDVARTLNTKTYSVHTASLLPNSQLDAQDARAIHKAIYGGRPAAAYQELGREEANRLFDELSKDAEATQRALAELDKHMGRRSGADLRVFVSAPEGQQPKVLFAFQAKGEAFLLQLD